MSGGPKLDLESSNFSTGVRRLGDKKAAAQRLVRSVGATTLYPVVTAIIQLVSVPVFIHYWGPSLYGEWLLLSTVPFYLALSDMGFGSVAGNDMTMRVAAGDRAGALRSFQTAWLMICAVSAAVGGSAVLIARFLPLRTWLHVTALSPTQFTETILLLIVYALGTLQTTLASSGFRCDGQYATGALLLNVVRLVEALGCAAAAAFGVRLLGAAILLVAARWSGFLLMVLILRWRSPWIVWGRSYADWHSLLQMARPAVAFMAFPIGNAFSIQGMLLVVGVAMGPLAVAVFSTMRTLTRVGFMILETIRHSIWPELSIAYGVEDWAYARKLHAKACQAALFLGALAVILLDLLGPRIYQIWTRHELVFDATVFHVLLVVVIADSLWYASAAASLACNAHQRIAAAYFFSTSASLVLAYFAMQRLGLLGPALALLAIDIPMTRFVLRSSLSILRETPHSFVRELCSPPRLRHFAAQITGRSS